MAKGWVKVVTVNDVDTVQGTTTEKNKRMHSFNNMIRNIKPKTAFEMKKESEELYEQAKAREDNLVAAYNDKRLKSKNAIKEARAIIKARAAAKNKAKEEKQAVSE
jgi:hypothetical protein